MPELPFKAEIQMKRLLKCEFNMYTVCVELNLLDGTMITIDTTAIENEVADTMYQRSELDLLQIYLSRDVGFLILSVIADKISNSP